MNEVGHLGSNPGNPANIQRLKIVKLLSIISAAAKLLLLGETIDFRSRENEWFFAKVAQNFNVLFFENYQFLFNCFARLMVLAKL